jgi:hypothetical protein
MRDRSHEKAPFYKKEAKGPSTAMEVMHAGAEDKAADTDVA